MMARAPWDRPGESASTRRLRIAIFFGTIAVVAVALGAIAWGVIAILGPVLAG